MEVVGWIVWSVLAVLSVAIGLGSVLMERESGEAARDPVKWEWTLGVCLKLAWTLVFPLPKAHLLWLAPVGAVVVLILPRGLRAGDFSAMLGMWPIDRIRRWTSRTDRKPLNAGRYLSLVAVGLYLLSGNPREGESWIYGCLVLWMLDVVLGDWLPAIPPADSTLLDNTAPVAGFGVRAPVALAAEGYGLLVVRSLSRAAMTTTTAHRRRVEALLEPGEYIRAIAAGALGVHHPGADKADSTGPAICAVTNRGLLLAVNWLDEAIRCTSEDVMDVESHCECVPRTFGRHGGRVYGIVVKRRSLALNMLSGVSPQAALAVEHAWHQYLVDRVAASQRPST